jgi:hypothetical protein
MAPSAFQSAKLALVEQLGLSKDALHIYVGLGIFLVATVVSRKRLGSPLPWLLVLLAAAAGEAWDRHDDLTANGHWQWQGSVHDLWNTLFWPTILLLLGRLGLLAGRPAK